MANPNANYKRKLVNPDLISLAHTPKVSVEITGDSYRMHAPGLSKNEDEAVTVFPVINLDTGETALLMSTSVLERTLHIIPGGYVGKSFEIEAGAPRGDKKYRPVKVWQLEA